ncbi:MAG TPA: hypothetical protein PLP42_18725 [Acidobacteriota bacterium]|jgi:hypothetical protein|nr:hypothetical protein [Acidobacteriota bacterium]
MTGIPGFVVPFGLEEVSATGKRTTSQLAADPIEERPFVVRPLRGIAANLTVLKANGLTQVSLGRSPRNQSKRGFQR